MHRRDLLKLFGIGATIIPVIGGVPEIAAPAKLIAEPIIEPVQLATAVNIEDLMRRKGAVSITVDMVSDGRHFRFQADSFISECNYEMIDISTFNDQFRRTIPGRCTVGWTLKGICTGQSSAQMISSIKY